MRKLLMLMTLASIFMDSYGQGCPESSFRINRTLNARSRWQVAQVSGNLYDPVNGFTWECWINLAASQGGFGGIITAGDGNADSDHFLWISGTTPSFNIRDGLSTSATFTTTSSVNLQVGVWTHIAGVCDYTNNRISIYINGCETGSAAAGGIVAGNRLGDVGRTTPPLTIGTFADSSNFSINADIDEVRIWRRPLAAAELRNNLYGCFATTDATLEAYFKADENTGTSSSSVVNGYSANAHSLAAWGVQAPTASCIDNPLNPTFQNANFWRLNGNTTTGTNFIGTINNDNLRINTNSVQRMVVSSTGNVGIGTTTPTARLHVNLTSLTATTGARFEGLATSSETAVLVADAQGNITKNTSIATGNTTNSCATTNFVPKLSGTNTYSCSQIFDNGTSVGINATSGFTYSSLAGAQQGATTIPSSGTIKLEVNGSTRMLALFLTSDSRFKTNVKPISNALEIVKKLNGKTYQWNSMAKEKAGGDNGFHIGYMAQELEKVIPEVVITNDEGNKAVNYTEIIPLLSEAIKEQQSMIEKQSRVIEALNERLSRLDRQVSDICSSGCGGLKPSINPTKSYLLQNVPNPYSTTTRVEWFLAECKSNCYLIISDQTGRKVMEHNITAAGSGELNLNLSLGDGTYLYTLYEDGVAVDTKRMVSIKR